MGLTHICALSEFQTIGQLDEFFILIEPLRVQIKLNAPYNLVGGIVYYGHCNLPKYVAWSYKGYLILTIIVFIYIHSHFKNIRFRSSSISRIYNLNFFNRINESSFSVMLNFFIFKLDFAFAVFFIF